MTVHQTRLATLFASHGADPLEGRSRFSVLKDVQKKREENPIEDSDYWVSENTCFAYHVVNARVSFLREQQQYIKKKLPIWLYSIGRNSNKGKFLPKDMINTIISFYENSDYEKSENFIPKQLKLWHKGLINQISKIRRTRGDTDDWKDDDKINYKNTVLSLERAESYWAFG